MVPELETTGLFLQRPHEAFACTAANPIVLLSHPQDGDTLSGKENRSCADNLPSYPLSLLQPVAAQRLGQAPTASPGQRFHVHSADSYLPEQLLVNTPEPHTPGTGFLQPLIQAAEETSLLPF